MAATTVVRSSGLHRAIALTVSFVLLTLLTASVAGARTPHGPRTATRGPAIVEEPGQQTRSHDVGSADGLLVGGLFVVVAVGVATAVGSGRGPRGGAKQASKRQPRLASEEGTR